MYGDFLNFEQLYLLHFQSVIYLLSQETLQLCFFFLNFTVTMNGAHVLGDPANFGGLLLPYIHVKYSLCYRFNCHLHAFKK